MKLMLGNDDRIAEWISNRIPYLRGESLGPCTTFTVANDAGTKILGAVAFHNYRPTFRSVEWSAAADTPNWLSVPIINKIMAYPFSQLGCVRITAFIAKKNRRSCEFQERFGFKHEGTLRRQAGGDDLKIYGLLNSEWKRSRFNLKRVVPQPAAKSEQPEMMVN